MAYEEGSAQILRDALAHLDGISEKRMFGGLCFLMNGNMLCGVHKGGGMARVGKDRETDALSIPGASPMTFTGRPMGGMVDLSDDLLADEVRLAAVLDHAISLVSGLPAK